MYYYGETHKGELEFIFTIGKQYKEDKITIYHKLASEEIETKTAKVKSSWRCKNCQNPKEKKISIKL